MLPPEVKTLAAIRYCPHQHGLVRAKVVARIGLGEFLAVIAVNRPNIKHRSTKMSYLATLLARHIADHGKRLEINLGRHDRRAETQDNSAFQALQRMRKDEKVPITCI